MEINNNESVTVELNTNDDNIECHVTIKGQVIPCSREVYLTPKRLGRKEAMRRYRGQRPFINGKRCQEDCSKCPHFIPGLGCTNKGDVSLNQLYESSFDKADSIDIEDECLINIRIQEMYAELSDEDQRCLDIFSLMIKETPQRAIASELDIADGTVTYYIKKFVKNSKNSDKAQNTVSESPL